MNMCKFAIATFSLFLSFNTYAKVLNSSKLQYCIPVEKINFNPFRNIEDGKELAYLVFLRSYISTDSSEKGILSQYEFSPDGKIFTGKISEDLKWADGTPVTSIEAAFGIAKALEFRMLGGRVKVIGTEQINSPGWLKRKYEGIEIIDNRSFKLKLRSDIENLTGVLREALSTNSRHNRFWPIKLKDEDASLNPEVLARFPSFKEDGKFGLDINHKKVIFTDLKNCKNPKFSIYPEVFRSTGKLLSKKSPFPSAITLQINTERISLKLRKDFAGWIRSIFLDVSGETGIERVKSFFLIGEPGFDKNINWSSNFDLEILKRKKIVIAYGIPVFKKIIEAAAKKNQLNIELISIPFERKDVDAQIMSSAMIEARHVMLQDILKWPHVENFFGKSSETRARLEKIAELSASTVPPDLHTLNDFEKVAMQEFSFIPVARRYPIAWSEAKISICLDWTKKGELTFSEEEKCL